MGLSRSDSEWKAISNGELLRKEGDCHLGGGLAESGRIGSEMVQIQTDTETKNLGFKRHPPKGSGFNRDPPSRSRDQATPSEGMKSSNHLSTTPSDAFGLSKLLQTTLPRALGFPYIFQQPLPRVLGPPGLSKKNPSERYGAFIPKPFRMESRFERKVLSKEKP